MGISLSLIDKCSWKTERTVLVEFSEKEAEMYAELERTALDAYLPLREKVGSAHYFHSDDDPIFPKLNTLRQACAGVLLGDNNGGEPDDIDGGSSLVFASKALAGPIFQSKFFAVVEELKRVRSLEPNGKEAGRLCCKFFCNGLTFGMQTKVWCSRNTRQVLNF